MRARAKIWLVWYMYFVALTLEGTCCKLTRTGLQRRAGWHYQSKCYSNFWQPWQESESIWIWTLWRDNSYQTGKMYFRCLAEDKKVKRVRFTKYSSYMLLSNFWFRCCVCMHPILNGMQLKGSLNEVFKSLPLTAQQLHKILRWLKIPALLYPEILWGVYNFLCVLSVWCTWH